MLITARVIQGLGAAGASPAALALVITLFTDPTERTKALGLWGGLAGLGGTLGVVLSGVITDLSSWRWIFLINVPIVAVVLNGVGSDVVGRRARLGSAGSPRRSGVPNSGLQVTLRCSMPSYIDGSSWRIRG